MLTVSIVGDLPLDGRAVRATVVSRNDFLTHGTVTLVNVGGAFVIDDNTFDFEQRDDRSFSGNVATAIASEIVGFPRVSFDFSFQGSPTIIRRQPGIADQVLVPSAAQRR